MLEKSECNKIFFFVLKLAIPECGMVTYGDCKRKMEASYYSKTGLLDSQGGFLGSPALEHRCQAELASSGNFQRLLAAVLRLAGWLWRAVLWALPSHENSLAIGLWPSWQMSWFYIWGPRVRRPVSSQPRSKEEAAKLDRGLHSPAENCVE